MDSNLLGAIASNNGISDISAALDYRQARLDRDEAKRKEIRQNQLVGKALSTGLVEGSPMHELASNHPQSYLSLMKVMGKDPSDGAGVHQMTQDADIISAYGKAGDVNGAINYMQESKAQRDRLGLPTKHLTSGLQAIQEDAPKFLRATQMISNTFHPKANGAMNEKDREDIRLKEKELDWKMSQPEGGGLSPKDVVMTPSGAYVFDKRTGGFSKGLDESGRPIIGASYDPSLQREIAGAKSGGAEQAKGNATRSQDFINQGVASAQAIPTIKRSVDLLNSIETGGLDAARIKAKQMFGIESADEGELTYNLGKTVLSQLKDTFGSAFTAAEGERLATLEAGLGRNPESNKRILANALQTMQKKAERGIQAARDNGDEFSASDIESYMKMSIGEEKKKSTGGSTIGRFQVKVDQ